MAAYLDAFLSRIGLRGPEESKVLFIGQDAAGKTALLYRLKFPEQDMLTTIPTIGFNVESVRVRSPAGARGLQIWDVGGCDRIRPLWRHYFAGTDLVVIFMTGEDCCAGRAEEAGLILSELAEDETVRRPFLILVTKQDLPGAAGPDEFRRVHAKELRKFAVMSPVLGISVTTRKGFDELASFMVEACSSKQSGVPSILPPKGSEENEKPKLLEWLERQDEPNDEFLAKLADCTLDSWDHRTHLRIAWLHLTRFGRREGLERTFNSIRNFIANSERARKTTFHFTMTYFFIHLVHYAIVSTLNPTGDFPGFLAANPQLSDGGIYLRYYSKQLMLHTPESRERMVLPDLKPLPSII
ncbi:ADP-ribosylation factor, partial [Hyaloraphidium curvatum]